jgi:hypothetical protein
MSHGKRTLLSKAEPVYLLKTQATQRAKFSAMD